MVGIHRSQIIFASASGVCALVSFSALAFAQAPPPDIECKKTETQGECHLRLKCKPDEELEDCQKRLLKCSANEQLQECKKRVGAKPAKEGNAGQRDDAGRNRGAGQQGGERRDRDNPDREREERQQREERREREERKQRDERQQREERQQRDDRRERDERANPRRQRGERQGDAGERRRSAGGSGFEANKTFGLGLELGEPTGLNGKYFLSRSGALDFGLGWMFGPYYYGEGFHIYADYLWHPISLVSASAFELPLYVGGGLRFWDFHYCFQGICNYGGSAIGVRIPVGVAFDFNRVPLDIFIQLVPVIDFITGDYYNRFGDRAHLGIDASAGIRYWFK